MFNRLQRSPVNTPIKIQITDKYLPIFLRGQKIKVTAAKVILKTSGVATIAGFSIIINNQELKVFLANEQMGGLFAGDKLAKGAVLTEAFPNGIIGECTLTIKNTGPLAPELAQPGDTSALDPTKLLDMILYFEYTLV